MNADYDNGRNGLREFGNFRLDVEKRVLWFEGKPVALQPKEIDMLAVLTENPGEVVTKRELLDRVWADSFVQESNLSRHVYQIRKAFSDLGESNNLIQTVSRRGYRFTAEVTNAFTGEITIERHSISRTVIEEVESPVRTGTNDELRRTRFALPLLVVAVAVGLAAGLYLYSRASVSDKPIRSIAVLPFRSVDGEQNRALSIGMADTLIGSLGKLAGIRVSSTATVSAYIDKEQDPVEIGRQLGVDAVLEGAVQKADGKLRVTLRLVRTTDGSQIWSETFDGAETEVFVLQDAIATRTASALSVSLTRSDRERILKRYTENSDAYQAYQAGRYLHFQRQYPKAIDQFERALHYDPKYVLAYAGLADSYAFLANDSDGNASGHLYDKAKSYALQALALDEGLAEAHISLGWIRRIYDWDWVESEKHLRRAIELDPNSSVAHQRLAYLYITLGRTAEAVQLSTRAKELDPVSHSAGWALYCHRQYEASLAEYARRLSLATAVEKQSEPRLGMAAANIALGNFAEAVRVIEEAPQEVRNDFAIRAAYTIALHNSGRSNEATELLRLLERLTEEKAGRWVRLAYVYAAMNRNADAIRALRRGIETRDDRLMWLQTTPYFDGMRGDAGFKSIVAEMRLS